MAKQRAVSAAAAAPNQFVRLQFTGRFGLALAAYEAMIIDFPAPDGSATVAATSVPRYLLSLATVRMARGNLPASPLVT